MSERVESEQRPAAAGEGNLGAFAIGVTGLGFGVASLMFAMPTLGLVAGLCSLGAAVGTLRKPTSQRTAPSATGRVDQSSGPVLAPSNTDAMQGGLLSAEYFEVALRNRVTTARRFLKPVAVVRLQIIAKAGTTALDRDRSVAVAIHDTLRECDTACVMNETDIALVLEDTPENGAVWVVERVRRALEDRLPAHVWAGIACYPTHAMDADELLSQANAALERARDWPQDRIEVAYAE